ncbi:MAG: F0F1 ATP synthase subunit delta [Alphaproteobacteria bacterium]|nr:F0F1 ATP synthase subunit delta [Alphaproteobacteria bacterium]
MAEIATIARPYAEALFKAGAGQHDAISGWLDEVAAVSVDSQVHQLSGNPKVSSQQLFDLIAGLVQSFQGDMARNFLRTVIENDRLAALPAIAHQFRSLKNAQGGTSDALVGSAFPIDAAALTDLKATLEKRFGRKLNLSVEIQPELIGGIRVVVGDEVLDTSVRARLEQMKVALTA